MCGIFCGYNLAIDKKKTKQVLSLLNHRGPDAQGMIHMGKVTMIHTRLAIIDLSGTANQPMSDPEQSVVLVFNGEIYNYLELKQELKNYPYKSHTDSEVLIAGYKQWGEEFIQKLRGMFSFCLYDRKTEKIIFAVDRFGIKPLYYYQKDGQIIASSEIKPILLFLKEYQMNAEAIGYFLNYGILDFDENTFFKDIRQLQGGEMMVWQNGSLKKKKYWQLSDIQEQDYEFKDLVDLTRSKLKESMALHWRSDVDVGFNLSSGLDSNLIYELSRASFPERQKLSGFTFCFPGTIYDEGARIDSGRFNVDHVKTSLSPKDLFENLDELVGCLEEPALGLGCLGYFLNAKTIRSRGIKVVLDGQGADEIFGGYRYYYIRHLKELYLKKSPSFEYELEAFWELHKGGKTKETFLAEILSSADAHTVQAPDGTFLDGNNFVSEEFQKAHFRPFPTFPRIFADPVKNMMLIDLRFLKIPKLLRYQDKTSMHSGVEVRVPYLDHDLALTLLSAKSSMHLRDGKTKALLREIYKDFGVQDQTAENRKLYVATPQREWMKTDCRNEILRYIDDSHLDRAGIINVRRLKKDYLSYCASPELGNSFFIWKFINLEIWFRKFFSD